MTRRRPARTLLLAAVVLLALDVLLAVQRAVPLLLLIAAVSGFAWLRARHRLPWHSRSVLPSQGHGKPRATVVLMPDLAAENAALRDENDRLWADLQDARMSAQMAWDAAADRSPRPARPTSPGVAQLLSRPRSGVRPLHGSWDEQ